MPLRGTLTSKTIVDKREGRDFEPKLLTKKGGAVGDSGQSRGLGKKGGVVGRQSFCRGRKMGEKNRPKNLRKGKMGVEDQSLLAVPKKGKNNCYCHKKSPGGVKGPLSKGGRKHVGCQATYLYRKRRSQRTIENCCHNT